MQNMTHFRTCCRYIIKINQTLLRIDCVQNRLCITDITYWYWYLKKKTFSNLEDTNQSLDKTISIKMYVNALVSLRWKHTTCVKCPPPHFSLLCFWVKLIHSFKSDTIIIFKSDTNIITILLQKLLLFYSSVSLI